MRFQKEGPEPMTLKSMKLLTPVELHGKTYSELSFKEPSADQFLDLGDTHSLIKLEGGENYMQVENPKVLRSYTEASVQGEHGPVLLRLLSLADAKAARELVMSFFTDAAAANMKKSSQLLS
jgi:hypothetical protein